MTGDELLRLYKVLQDHRCKDDEKHGQLGLGYQRRTKREHEEDIPFDAVPIVSVSQ